MYAHNLSSFDGIFILKELAKLHKPSEGVRVSIIKNENSLVNINIKRKGVANAADAPGYSINFRDSLLLLPSSLRKLGKAFGVSEKSYFP